MKKYVLTRIVHTLVSIIILSMIVFGFLRLMPTEGYFTRQDYQTYTEAEREQILIDNGLKGSPIKSYFNYMKGAVVFDFGKTNRVAPINTEISEIFLQKAKYSLQIGLPSIFISIIFGSILGVIMARGKDKLPDHAGTVYIVIVRAVPSLVYLLLFKELCVSVFHLPIMFEKGNAISLILPIISLSLGSTAWYATWVRRFIVDEENRDYIKLARAKGLPENKIYTGHIFRNAIVPLVHYLPAQILLTISGSLIIESLYTIPGLGGLLIFAINELDNGLVLALVLIFGALSIVGVFIGDILMVLVDPRIKLVEEEA